VKKSEENSVDSERHEFFIEIDDDEDGNAETVADDPGADRDLEGKQSVSFTRNSSNLTWKSLDLNEILKKIHKIKK
jgi:hypothetical protein